MRGCFVLSGLVLGLYLLKRWLVSVCLGLFRVCGEGSYICCMCNNELVPEG